MGENIVLIPEEIRSHADCYHVRDLSKNQSVQFLDLVGGNILPAFATHAVPKSRTKIDTRF